MEYDLKGKIVLITGGASGIGLSCVKALLRNQVQNLQLVRENSDVFRDLIHYSNSSALDVAVNLLRLYSILNIAQEAVTIADIDVTKGEQVVNQLMQEFGNDRIIFVKIDVTKTGHLEAAFKVTLDFWKTVDIVINNAAIMNDSQWEHEISLNCNGVVQGTLLGLDYMGKDKGGKGGVIVNMSSIHGLEPFAPLPIYAGTKHFVIGFSRSLADSYHYNRTGVKILTMCPGVTDTSLITALNRRPLKLSSDIGQRLTEEIAASQIQSVEKVAEDMITLITKKRNGSVSIVVANKPIYEVLIPHRSTFQKLNRK